jgi:hypothetical protein
VVKILLLRNNAEFGSSLAGHICVQIGIAPIETEFEMGNADPKWLEVGALLSITVQLWIRASQIRPFNCVFSKRPSQQACRNQVRSALCLSCRQLYLHLQTDLLVYVELQVEENELCPLILACSFGITDYGLNMVSVQIRRLYTSNSFRFLPTP